MPREVFEQVPSQQGADGRPQTGDGRPDAQRRRPLFRVREDDADERQRGGHDHRAAHAQECAHGNHNARRVGEKDQEGGHSENGVAEHEHAFAAPTVSDCRPGYEKACEHQRVDVDDPQLLGGARLEVLGQVGKRDVQNRHVHGYDQNARAEHGRGQPPAGCGQRLCRRGAVFCLQPRALGFGRPCSFVSR